MAALNKYPPFSEDTPLLSSPNPVIFSDEPTSRQQTTPPSSPPPTVSRPTSSQSCSPPKNAFSILGKRKPLLQIPNNVLSNPSNKRVKISPQDSPQQPPKSKTSTTTMSSSKTTINSNKPALTQLQLSIGQQTQKRCRACGMTYVLSSAEDRKLHERFHRQKTSTRGYEVGAGFLEKFRREAGLAPTEFASLEENGKGNGVIFRGVEAGDAICVVSRHSSRLVRKRAREVLELVQGELGAVEIAEEELWGSASVAKKQKREDSQEGQGRYRALLYVREGRVVGFLLVEKISEAKMVLDPSEEVKSAGQKKGITAAEGTSTATTALQALKARRQALLDASKEPIRLSKRTRLARLGVSRVWTLGGLRAQGIAARMLDVAFKGLRSWWMDELGSAKLLTDMKREKGRTVDKEVVAFSQPTDCGVRLARKWFGRVWGWSVYTD